MEAKMTMKKRYLYEALSGYAFVLPFIASISIFLIGPLIYAFIISFKEFSFLNPEASRWVGFANYIKLFSDPTFKRALLNTTLYSLGVVPTQLIIALILALIVNSNIKGKTFFRVAYYIPTVTSTVAVSVIFLYLFKADGLVNVLLAKFGIQGPAWFNDVRFALPSIMMMAIWSSVGNYMVIFLAGLQDIPSELYEAAEVDGANKFQRFFKITLPMLRPIVFFNLVMSLIGTFQVFDQAYVVSQGTGGPLDATMTVVLDIYRTGFRDFNMGYASAMAFALFVIILILTLIQRKLFKEETY
ncbi:carbohydrate ABC transporter membrane protein 1, CUT1 family [Thermoanaerobacter thermohydrosulfuricus]|uniref:ABC-type sugar transport system, permease component n=2 Tax=Thermoanaerobacter thermohydrosulfuricus TaxID=1516 RepID=M8DIV2_THETY|nr:MULTISPECIES: sugar ABC transporter permease [Thermoanaerobacter]HHW57068.1 sugar ABC transporter permease [Clostridia bacterium]EMT40017.1 ABC-type sugar transport system, permease component [Thermoanaerobacter thermohydrosulfuricus WC1]UZQ83774.1 sugar ABC transporter permease [Thermoanaerobacter sp. RKWS2]SDF31848.1 carbohydrate ABC transporter membrane protein 1, CUT1 family [Thermoanaerobacter thermohydrosulfuricus]SFE16591.1 carbohydrate ABC transporter membrane protein 1, CUT1 family